MHDYPNISDRIYEILCKRIIARKLKPGQRLVEEGLAKELGVSRTPLRDAINRLAKDGFVDIAPRKGASVKSFQIEDVAEVYEIREVLESLATRLAIDNLKTQDLEKLKALFSKDDTETLLKADSELHNLIIHSCNNNRLVEILDNLSNLIQVFRVAGYISKERSDKATSDHRAIVDTLLKRNAKLAETLMRKHIEKTRQDILENFENRK